MDAYEALELAGEDLAFLDDVRRENDRLRERNLMSPDIYEYLHKRSRILSEIEKMAEEGLAKHRGTPRSVLAEAKRRAANADQEEAG